jgi:hypothetical protein
VEDTDSIMVSEGSVVDERDSVWVADWAASFLWMNSAAEWPALSAVLPVNVKKRKDATSSHLERNPRHLIV